MNRYYDMSVQDENSFHCCEDCAELRDTSEWNWLNESDNDDSCHFCDCTLEEIEAGA